MPRVIVDRHNVLSTALSTDQHGRNEYQVVKQVFFHCVTLNTISATAPPYAERPNTFHNNPTTPRQPEYLDYMTHPGIGKHRLEDVPRG